MSWHNSFVCVLVAVGTLLVAQPTYPRSIHYGAVNNDQVEACDRLSWKGKRAEAMNCYQDVLADRSAPNSALAEASWALKDVQRANDYFRSALKDNPGDLDVKARWGDLFSSTHQDAEAMAIYQEVLQQKPNHGFALVGAARLLASGFESSATDFLAKVPEREGAAIPAALITAWINLENGDVGSAKRELNKAEAMATDGEWPLLDVYALRAAADLLGNTRADWTEKALEINPRFGEIYSVPAHFYVITRRYREAIALYQKAVKLDPNLTVAHRELGINLLRDNRVSEARYHLELAYTQDPFSPISVNTLRLLDSFKHFDTIGYQPEDPTLVPMTLRLHEDESAVLSPYTKELAEQAMLVFRERYGFRLKEPIVIEMYPDHADFAVRTAGMPGLGILGAAFGYLVAMDSPSARPVEQFQWGTTLWHELAHIYTLEATNHLVPRWFSEGASVFEEWRSGPNPGVRISMSVLQAIKDGKMLSVAELDEGFIRPTYPQQVIVSYMQAGLICDFINQNYPDGLKNMLKAFAEGQSTENAITQVLDLSISAFDKQFNEYVEQNFGAVFEQFEHWHDAKKAMTELLAKQDWEAVQTKARELIAITPNYVEPDSPYLALSLAQSSLEQSDEALETLLEYWRKGGYHPSSLMRLAKALEERGDKNQAINVLNTLHLVDPFDESSHAMLGELYLDVAEPVQALREFQVAMALSPHDQATAHYRVGQAYFKMGDTERAQSALIKALEVAPNFRPAQKLLLKVVSQPTS
ncbi:MAG: tetratricopeptide repeat protein [Pseudomonadota bacterium]